MMANIAPNRKMHWGGARYLLTFITIWSTSSFASADVHPMRFDRLTQDDGLSQSSVISIHQDSEGFIWFGTENGLNRYDGYEFKHFRRDRGNNAALRNDFIFALTEARDGGLWIATNGGGLSYFDADRQQFRNFLHDPANPEGIGGNIVRALLRDRDDRLWVGMRGAGLDRYDARDGKFHHIDLGGPASVFALYQDRRGAIWAGADEGLFRIDPETGAVRHFANDPDDGTSLSGNQVRSLLEDARGNLWIGTRGAGLNRFSLETSTFEHFRNDPSNPASLSSDRVTAILEDDAGRLWIGTADGLNLFDRNSGNFRRFQNESADASSLGGNSVAALYQDRGGIIWVGTLTGGISKWNPRTWTLGFLDSRDLAESNEESRPNVSAITTDADGKLWIGTFGDGLIRRDRDTGKSVHYRFDPADPDSISDDRIMSLRFGSDGKLWIGTMTGGLNRFDPLTGRNSVFRHDPADPTSISANGIMTIFEDSSGLVWAGTFGGGISVFDPIKGHFTRYAADGAEGSLSSDRVTSIAEDRNGMIWVGTDGGGLNILNPKTGRFQAYRYDGDDPTSVADETIYSLHVDGEGTVWVGTRGGGLDRVAGSSTSPADVRFANVSQKNGLANDVIYSIQSDANGDIWLSTNYGISRLNPETGAIRNLHSRDGLQSEEFNFGASHRSPKGELFFGGINGYNAFKPETLATNSKAPAILLTGINGPGDRLKSGIPVDTEKGVELSYRDDIVNFQFAALDYSSPEKNRYMYKLEGFNEEWIDLGNRRRITFTDLSDGNYLLRVRAANSDGVWNDAGISIPVRVTPAPWDTWWAYLGYIAIAMQLGLFLWWGHQRKLQREEEYSRRLEQEVQKRTDELSKRNDELRQLNRSLQESSLSDPLTGLRNRRFVFEEVSREMSNIGRKHEKKLEGLDPSKAADLVFMVIDLDNFKPINDTYGHAAGDKVLLDIRDVLLSTCRRSDFVIRWGGDEFVVIAKQAHPGESEALAERIRQRVASAEFVLPDGQIVRTTCSIGFTAFPLFSGQARNGSLDDVINIADNLMYEAKRERNAWVGMLSINEAVTSEGYKADALEPTSLLFRARRQGTLTVHEAGNTTGRAIAG
ncbi:MAG: diguanylate cyclase [Gammaproteobacteria bacterium]|nr:diguanylate cyclase [Gammaproteobacteria bacterium]MDH4253416.1 diguanylate cyclase [Gammaproteobacteria bacterium]MDH5309221.1 diguanylate cyclase [Gammaproteobacteria bacterium]